MHSAAGGQQSASQNQPSNPAAAPNGTGAPQRDRNRRSRQQYRVKARGSEGSSSAGAESKSSQQQQFGGGVAAEAVAGAPDQQHSSDAAAGVAQNDAFAALFAKNAKIDSPTASSLQSAAAKQPSQLAELEERMLANADASGVQSIEQRLQKYVSDRAELDQLVMEEVKRIVQEADRVAKTKELHRAVAEQLETERKERKEVEERMTSELSAKSKQLQELQEQHADREQLVTTQEQRIAALEADLAEHQRRLGAAVQELNAAQHQYFLKNEELAKLQLETFKARGAPGAEAFRSADLQAALERAEADKNWYLQHLNQLVAENKRLEAQLQQQPHLQAQLQQQPQLQAQLQQQPQLQAQLQQQPQLQAQLQQQPQLQGPPPPLGLVPHDALQGAPSPAFGSHDASADKMMFFGKQPPPGFQQPHYHSASTGERAAGPQVASSAPGGPVSGNSPLSRAKMGQDAAPGQAVAAPVEDPFAAGPASANGGLDSQLGKPAPPGFRPEAGQLLQNQNRPDPVLSNSSLLPHSNGVSSSQPLAPIGHPVGLPWRPPYDNFASNAGSNQMTPAAPAPPADRHSSLNSRDPVLHYPHNPALWNQHQGPISHPQKVGDANKTLGLGLNNQAIGPNALNPEQLPGPSPHNFGPLDLKGNGPMRPAGFSRAPVGGMPMMPVGVGSGGIPVHEGEVMLFGPAGAQPPPSSAPVRMSMRQEVVVTPLAPNRPR